MKDCVVYSEAKIVEIRGQMLGFNNQCGMPSSSVEGSANGEKPMPKKWALKFAGVLCGYTGRCK